MAIARALLRSAAGTRTCQTFRPLVHVRDQLAKGLPDCRAGGSGKAPQLVVYLLVAELRRLPSSISLSSLVICVRQYDGAVSVATLKLYTALQSRKDQAVAELRLTHLGLRALLRQLADRVRQERGTDLPVGGAARHLASCLGLPRRGVTHCQVFCCRVRCRCTTASSRDPHSRPRCL